MPASDPRRRPRRLDRLLRGLVIFHRWAGVVLCLFFAVWFASGAVLVFVPFPALAEAARQEMAEPIRLDRLAVAPAEALQRAGGGEVLRLVGRQGEPVYLAKAPDTPWVAIDGRTGRTLAPLSGAQARGIAEAATGRTARMIAGPVTYDQWVVHQKFDPWRPFFRVDLEGPGGATVYVSARTGELVQRTTRAERAWNWLGAIPHWLYFTVLRQSFAAWDQTVWWVALVGVATTAAGVWLGVQRTLRQLGGRRRDWSPFRGWMRWHHGLGLAALAGVVTWMVSGWLSMDHGRLFSRPDLSPAASAAYAGGALERVLAGVQASALSRLAGAREIEFEAVAGRPIASADAALAPKAADLRAETPAAAAVPTALLLEAARAAWPGAAVDPAPDDAVLRAAEGFPDRAVRFALPDAGSPGLYVDPVTGRPLAYIDASRRAYGWVYYAMHTFKFPGLLERPTLRRAVELAPLALGFAFSVTGLVVAVRRLRMTRPPVVSFKWKVSRP